MNEKIKPTINGTAETMLQSFYARAQYSKSKNHKFYDAKAVELVDKIDYDFSAAAKDSTMGKGVVARTIVFDELVKDFIEKNPDCTVVNIACGLDTRFYRMDNGKITWYNLDLPETIAVRNQIFEESGRVSTIGISALDPAWAKEVEVRGKMLFIMEGLSMYLTAEENGQILKIIKDHFDDAYVLMECLAKKWVKKEGIEKSIQQTGSKFVFGADHFEDLGSMTTGYHKIKDDNILRGMAALSPAYRFLALLPVAKKFSQKILIFEKDSLTTVKGELIIYQARDGITKVDCRFVDDTVWLTQQQMADLFHTSRSNVVEHIGHIYEEGELEVSSTCRKFRQVRMEGKRQVLEMKEILKYIARAVISTGRLRQYCLKVNG